MTLTPPQLLVVSSWLPSLTTGDWWAYSSALVVFIGVAGESIADLTQWIESESHKTILARTSALVLILGLAGDIISIHLTQIATASLNRKAGEAYEQAENAAKDAEGFRLQIAQSNERAAQAEARAAQAQLDLARYKAPRELTPEQQTALANALAAYPRIGVDVFIFGDTPEITRISGTLLTCMNRAKWDPHFGTVAPGSGIVVTGIFVGVAPPSNPTSEAAAKTLVSVLSSLGIPATMTSFEKMQFGGAYTLLNSTITSPKPIRVFIGSKP